RWVGPDDRLGAVAVMNVPVDDGDALGAVLLLRVTGGDDGVVEEAKAHRPVGLGVVARRADGAKGIGGEAAQNLVDRHADGAGCVRRRNEALRRYGGVGVEAGEALGRDRLLDEG